MDPHLRQAAFLAPKGSAIRKRPRRTHARRSCQMCQQRKARCELPDLSVPSGPDPLPEYQSCHRCRTLQISCIVDDSNKKRAKKLEEVVDPNGAGHAQSQPRIVHASSSNMGYTCVAQQHELGADLDSHIGDRPARRGYLVEGRLPAKARLVARTPSPSFSSPGSPSAQERESWNAKAVQSIAGLAAPHPLDMDRWEKYSMHSRPMTLLTELVPRQRRFASRTSRLDVDHSIVEADIRHLIDDEKSVFLSEWCEENLTIWLPHISNARALRRARLDGQPTVSAHLLEAALYLVALQHIMDPSDDVLRFSVARLVLRDVARVIVSSPRESKAVEALELLAVFPVDTSVLPGPFKNRIRTDGLMDAAERLARTLRMDRVPMTNQDALPFVPETYGPLDEFKARRQVCQWTSLKAWHVCFTLGDDELFENLDTNFATEASIRSVAMLDPSADDYAIKTGATRLSYGTGATAWWRRRRLGSVVVVQRALAVQRMLKAFESIRSIPLEAPDAERVARVDAILNDWRVELEALAAERNLNFPDSNPQTAMVADWLALEAAAFEMMLHMVGACKALGLTYEPASSATSVVKLLRKKQLSRTTLRFIAVHGEDRLDAAESVLRAAARLTQRRWSGLPAFEQSRGGARSSGATSSGPSGTGKGRSRLPAPMINVFGYTIEAALCAVDMYAKVIKVFKSAPRRSHTWQSVFQDVVEGFKNVDPSGSVENGSIAATSTHILKGMLEVIVCWTEYSRRISSEHGLPSSSQGPKMLFDARQHWKSVAGSLASPLDSEELQSPGKATYVYNMKAMAALHLGRQNAPTTPSDSDGTAPSLTASLFEAGSESGTIRGAWQQNYGFADQMLDGAAPNHGYVPHPSVPAEAGSRYSSGPTPFVADPTAAVSGQGASWAAPPGYESLGFMLNDILGPTDWTSLFAHPQTLQRS